MLPRPRNPAGPPTPKPSAHGGRATAAALQGPCRPPGSPSPALPLGAAACGRGVAEPGVVVGEEEVEPRSVAGVGSEDLGDYDGEGGGGDEDVGVEEVERCRGLEAALVAGEDLGAHGSGEVEEQEDGGEDAIGEEAKSRYMPSQPPPASTPSPLPNSGGDRRAAGSPEKRRPTGGAEKKGKEQPAERGEREERQVQT